jgi:ParB-like chromosome segregation protein Spo0J
MEIVNKKVIDLVPYANNSRTHTEHQISQIANSIKKFGFTNPILIDSNNTIIAGHGRLEAVKLLGHEEVPCIAITGLSKSQIRALIIADNKLALNATWNFQTLNEEIKNLKEEEFDLNILGFADLELTSILNNEIFNDTETQELIKDNFDQTNNFIIQYNIIFDNTFQQDAWFELIKNLKIIYPDLQTTGERLSEFIKSKNYGQG